MSVITLQEYKEYIGITNPNDDVKLEQLITYINSFIEKYCSTKFEPTAVVDRILTTTTNELIIPEVPIISVESIKLVQYSGTETEVTDYYLEPELGILMLSPSTVLPRNFNNIKISYTYGYDEIPVGLKVPAFEFVTYLAKREYIKSKTNSLGESTTYLDPSVVPVQVRAGLDLYRML